MISSTLPQAQIEIAESCGYPIDMNIKLQAILSELREGLETLYGARLAHLVLFGSHARDDASSDSDIDVLVVLRGPVSVFQEITLTSELVSGISLAHGIVIACVFMDEDRFRHRQGPLLRNIRREGVAV